jgi:ABC-type antimicrobial peptide transport system permease subunit
MILREGLTPTGIGLVAGVLLATLLTGAMASALFGVTPLDPVAFSAAPLLLFFVACVACLIPARRAVAEDPGDALRAE